MIKGRSERVLLLGGAGFPNYGDELIASISARFWREAGAEVTLNAIEPAASGQFFSARDITAAHTRSIWEHAWERKYASVREAIDAGLARYRGTTEFDVVHLHGGGYLNSMWTSSAYLVGVALAHKEAGARVFATGLGLEPLSDDDALALAEAAAAFDVFECRDSSATRLRSLGAKRVVAGVDDVFLEPALGSRRRATPNLHLALAFDQANDGYRHEVMEWLQAALERDQARFDQVVLWEFCRPNRDLDLMREGLDLSAVGDRVVLRSFEEMSSGGHPVASGDLAVASRFHAHLLFALAGARGIYVPGPDAYYQGKHRSLVDQGSQWRSYEDVKSEGGLAVGKSFGVLAGFFARRSKRRTYSRLRRI